MTEKTMYNCIICHKLKNILIQVVCFCFFFEPEQKWAENRPLGSSRMKKSYSDTLLTYRA